MPYPDALNNRRREEASARDVETAQKILALPVLYQQLTLGQRRVLMKRVEMPGASWTDIAAALNLSKSAAYARWHRAIEILPPDQPETNDPNLWNQAF